MDTLSFGLLVLFLVYLSGMGIFFFLVPETLHSWQVATQFPLFGASGVIVSYPWECGALLSVPLVILLLAARFQNASLVKLGFVVTGALWIGFL